MIYRQLIEKLQKWSKRDTRKPQGNTRGYGSDAESILAQLGLPRHISQSSCCTSHCKTTQTNLGRYRHYEFLC